MGDELALCETVNGTPAGRRGRLAGVGVRSPHCVGEYGLDLASLKTVGVAALRAALAAGHLVVVDEIGPMEILSEGFRSVVREALAADAPLLDTIGRRSTPFTDWAKGLHAVMLLEVRPDNRDALVSWVVGLIEELRVSPSRRDLRPPYG